MNLQASKLMRTPKLPDFEDLTVYIPEDIYDKVYHWINKSSHEVSGFGSLHFDKEAGIFTVTDAILIAQDNGPTSSEIDADALAVAMYEQRDQENGLKWWWHSHVNMNVFWSGDDMECIRSLGQHGWVLSTVFNKGHESRSSFYTTVESMGIKREVFTDDLDTIKLKPAIDLELVKQWDKEYSDKIKIKGYQAVNNIPHSWVNNNYGPYDLCGNEGIEPTYGLGCNQREFDLPQGDSISTFAPDSSDDTMIGWDEHGHGISAYGKILYNPYRDKTLDGPLEIMAAYEELPRDERLAIIMFDDELEAFVQEMGSAIQKPIDARDFTL